MWDWTGHMGGWWWVMAPLMVAFWALVIWGVVALVRHNQTASSGIDEVEYRRRRALIRS